MKLRHVGSNSVKTPTRSVLNVFFLFDSVAAVSILKILSLFARVMGNNKNNNNRKRGKVNMVAKSRDW